MYNKLNYKETETITGKSNFCLSFQWGNVYVQVNIFLKKWDTALYVNLFDIETKI